MHSAQRGRPAETIAAPDADVGLSRRRQPGARRLGRLRRLGRDPLALFGAAMLGLMVGAAVAAPLLAPHDPLATDLQRSLLPPVWLAGGHAAHPLGADAVGRDLLSRLLYGARFSLAIAGGVTVLAAGVGVLLGLLAGYFGGWQDQALMHVADVFLAFPGILLAITIIAVFPAGPGGLLLALVIAGWVQYARLTRGQTLAAKHALYVEAARVAGAGDWRILVVHILPNVISPIVVLAALQIAFVLLAEAALSFLGLGVGPATPTWGSMINDGRQYIYTAWWVITFPGLAITLTVLSANLVGDWLRDLLDPTQRIEPGR
jgi:ABC-type dipeptide/oligopeptide/nickel transport system permease subunit